LNLNDNIKKFNEHQEKIQRIGKSHHGSMKIDIDSLNYSESNYINNNKNLDEKTIVVYGEETTKLILKVLNNSKYKWDVYTNYEDPKIAMGLEPLKKGMKNAYWRGVKIRYLSEINPNNINYCKELMEIAEVRHLDEAKGGMAVSEIEYIATAHLQETKPVAHLIYSNVKEIIEQQQLVFESFWQKSIPAAQKIKEIEEGIDPIKTKLLEHQDEIYNHFMMTIERSKERYACWSVGGLQMVYNNFFNSYKNIVEKQKKGEGNGIKWLTYIDDDKNTIELVKIFLDAGIQIRHIKNLPSMNFSFDSKSIQLTIERMDKGRLMNSLLISNEPAYIKHFTSYFQELWNNYGIDALERIKDIEEGMEHYIEVIRHADRSLCIYLDIVKSATSEIFFIFPTPKAFIRQLKPIDLAIQASKERKVKVKILTPYNEFVERSIKHFLKEEQTQNPEISKESIISFSDHANVKIRYIEKMSNTKATILLVDRKESLVMELKDDTKDNFTEAIGLSTHSNSKANVLSYVAIFENLWKQSELYQELKESNENLKISNEKLKNNDKMQKEFINTAAHELRTPLQPILSLSQMLKDKSKDNSQKELLDIVIKNSKKLKNLTENILDVTKIEGNTLYLNKEKFRIGDLLQSIIKEFEYSIEDYKKIKFELHFENIDPNLVVIADQNRISQVISNLINNSIKFILKEDEKKHDTGLISTRIEKIKINDVDNDDKVIIHIKDNGEGINQEIFPRLFTKFASKSFQGTGLGLFIAKNIIEAHGGKIWAKNNEGEKGANFSFILPVFHK